MRRLWMIGLLLLCGCGRRPVADFLDNRFPPAMPRPNEPHHGGVCGGAINPPPVVSPGAPPAPDQPGF